MKVKSLGTKMPEIRIHIMAYNKIMEATNTCNNEIALLGCVKKENNSYIVYDAIIIEQEVHATTAEITEEGLSKLALELMEKENGTQMWNDIKMWYHSHVNMSTLPSTQDDKQMDLFIQSHDDFFIRMIGNKKEELKIDLYSMENGIVYEDLPFKMEYEEDVYNKIMSLNNQIKALKSKLEELITIPQDIKESIKKEIELKVTEKTYKASNVTIYGNNNNSNSRWFRGDKKNNVNKDVEKTAEEVFIESSDYEKYEMWEHIECGGTSCDLTREEMSLKESYKLDDMIEEFVNDNLNDYYMYLGRYY